MKQKNRWLIALAAVSIHLSIGSVYAYSVFKNPLMDQFGWDNKQVTVSFTLAICFLGLSAAAFGRFVEKYGPRKSATVSAILFSAGMLGAGLAVHLGSLTGYYLCYGVIGGIGLGIGYISPVSTLVKWFPDRRGLATGMAVMGFGAGSLICSPVAARLIDAVGVANTFYILGTAYFVLMMSGALYIARPPEGWMPKGMLEKRASGSERKAPEDLAQLTAVEALRTGRFWMLWVMMFVNISSGIMIISVASPMKHAFTEQVADRFTAYGWQVLRVEDGNDLHAIHEAIEKARQSDKPTLVEVKTIIGYGSPNKGGTSESHGAPLGEAEVALVRETYNWPYPPFEIPESVHEPFRQAVQRGEEAEQAWNELWNAYRQAYPEPAAELEKAFAGELPENWEAALPAFQVGDKVATRDASGKVLNALASAIPYFLGGSADLASSNKTMIRGEEAYQPGSYQGRNIWFGVREHAMAAALNGMSLHGGMKVFGGTFFVFSDYMKPAMRLSALMKQPVIYVMTHDSIAVGEDGPTHQPIEQLPGLRSIPNLLVLRPSDANETVAAYKIAVSERTRPSAIVLTRQALPVREGTEQGLELAHRGAYVRVRTPDGDPDLLLIASGSEVPLAMDAAAMLEEQGIKVNVISMISRELFEEQDREYRDSVIPPHIRKRVCIEMGSSFGWERYAGLDGLIIALDHFGASAPGNVLMEKFGFTKEQVASRIKEWYNG